MKSPILFDMRKTRVQSILDALAIALPSVLLLPAVLLAAIPIFSLPLGAASLYFFEWVYPEQFGSVVRHATLLTSALRAH